MAYAGNSYMCVTVANVDGQPGTPWYKLVNMLSVVGQLGRPLDMLAIRSRDLSSQCMWSTRKATVHAGHLCT